MPLKYGVHSEAGTLRRVMVHRPGLEMARLTPENREELLFDDVIWVKQARVEHMTFTDSLRERGGRGGVPARAAGGNAARPGGTKMAAGGAGE